MVNNINLNPYSKQDGDNEEDFSRHMKRDEEGPNLLMKLQVSGTSSLQMSDDAAKDFKNL